MLYNKTFTEVALLKLDDSAHTKNIWFAMLCMVRIRNGLHYSQVLHSPNSPFHMYMH